LAGRGARLVANLIDHAIVVGPAVVLVGILGALGDGKGGYPAFANGVFWILVLLGGVMQVLMQNRFGQSVGKRLLGVRVVGLNGESPSTWAIAGRALCQVVLGGCGVIALVDGAMILGAERRCLHDRVAKTRVVRAG
jgi:uncharacterized RDD family membrane protein YckC